MIKVFVTDVDGTLTDGKIYMSAEGEIMKAFNIKDGYGIHELLPMHGVKTVIMTGRSSEIVKNRAEELAVDIVIQGIKDKKAALIEIAKSHGWKMEEIAFIGDDMIDLPAMKISGVCGCPADAFDKVKQEADYITSVVAGEGAVREFAEWLISEGRIK